ERQRVSELIERAWAIICAVVSPALLERIGAAEIHVSRSTVRASQRGREIYIGPNTTLETILHEYGHHIETHGGLRVPASALAARTTRAFGMPKAPLRELTGNRAYGEQELAYPGGFISPYWSKSYARPIGLGLRATEQISMAFAYCISVQRARELFFADGDLFLRLMDVLGDGG
ncbi:MAG: hypothetical protein H6707_19025, partial [Deltaproteobacteria bacterium]|nr:hypothetical protein [Deltaproteobacteria bacterium]